ncbi:MAG: cache domain-containing protein [Flavobacteriaceae bacterium]|nr:cache domain-containing protein [Flavobacteriaceae bacterium]
MLLFFGCDNNQDEIDDLEAQIAQIKSQVSGDFSSQITNLENRISNLTTSINSLPTSDDVKNEVEKLQGAIGDLKSQVESGQDALTGLGDSIKKIDEHLAALESEVNPPSADKVKDDETLKAFVEWAKSEIEPVTDATKAAEIELKLRKLTDFNDGDDTYLLKVHQESGDLLTHGKDRDQEGLTLKGVQVIDDLIKAAEGGGGFVEYQDGAETKKAYAVSYKDGVTKADYVLIGGYTQDLSKVEGSERLVIDGLKKPSITASEVKNRETLEKFVEETIKILKEQFDKGPGLSIPRLRNSFREDGGHWKSGSVYIWIVSDRNVNLFHGANANLEHVLTNFDRVDQDGQRFVELLVNGARDNEEEGQFLEYTYDNPTNPADGDEPKLGFTKSFELIRGQGKFVIGSGIYTGDLKVTAQEVKDDVTLERFVEWAKSQIEPVTDITEAAKIELQLRKENSDFNDGNDTYLLKVHQASGDLLTHGKDRTVEGLTLSKVEVIDDLIKAAEGGGGFVDYQDGEETKKAYATSYKDGVTGADYLLIGGYTQDLKKIEGTERLEIENLPKPSTTASEVKDRKTLEDFVKEAARITKEQFDKGPNLSVPRLRNSFRKKAEDGGHWKSGSVYIWVVSGQNINLFHGANQNLEHEFANLDRLDDNGNEFIKILVNGARQDKENGRFLEYTYNNPTTTDDGDEPKLGFAYSVNLGPFLGDLVIGSGIYTGDLPETTKTTAKDVKDDDTETLKAFVEWAKSEIEPVTDVTKAAEIGLQLRGEDDDGNKKPNDFNDGDDTYLLVVLERTGDLLTHGKNRDFESKNLLEFRDDGGKRVIKQLIDKAKNEGGGFVKYQDDEGNTKSAYAVSYGDKIGRETYVLVGGGTLKTSPRLLT